MDVEGYNKDILFWIIPAWSIIPLAASIPFRNLDLALFGILLIPLATAMSWFRLTPGVLLRRFLVFVVGDKRHNRSPWRSTKL